MPETPSPSSTPPDPRAAANRANSQRSTGPVTAAGRARVSRNAVCHGLASPRPVLDAVESLPEWEAYLEALHRSLKPEGALESLLVERMALTGWRLRRLVRYETESVRRAHSAEQDRFEGRRASLTAEMDDARVILDFLRQPEGRRIDSEQVRPVLERAFHLAERGAEFEEYWDRCSSDHNWTVREVRDRLRVLATSASTQFPAFLAELGEAAEENITLSRYELQAGRRKLTQTYLEHLIPEDQALERILRYESHLNRQFHRDLTELQRLQAARKAGHPPLPAPVDAEVIETENLPTSEEA